jgi:hypothetical protein
MNDDFEPDVEDDEDEDYGIGTDFPMTTRRWLSVGFQLLADGFNLCATAAYSIHQGLITHQNYLDTRAAFHEEASLELEQLIAEVEGVQVDG